MPAAPVSDLWSECSAYLEVTPASAFGETFLCGSWQSSDVGFSLRVLRTEYADIPYVLAQKGLSSRKSDPVLVHMVGGPGERPLVSLAGREALLSRPIEEGASIVSVGYSGTAWRSLYPAADLPDAARDLEQVLSALSRQWPDGPQAVLAESLGANVTAHVLARRPDLPVFLVSPVLAGSQAGLRFYEKNASTRAKALNRHSVRQYVVRNGAARFDRVDLISSHDHLRRFFSGAAAEAVQLGENRCSVAAVGESDELALHEADTRKLGSRVTVIPKGTHTLYHSSPEELRAAFDRFYRCAFGDER